MNPFVCSLIPFPSSGGGLDLRIEATLMRWDARFGIAYRMEGDLGSVNIPEPAARPGRRDDLWKETCLEFFLAEPAAEPYWEFNLSPAGYWNAYRFSSYREGMREESSVEDLRCSSSRSGPVLTLETEIDLGWLHLETRGLSVGLSAVVRSADGRNTCWALTHPGPEPDFHRRDGFILRI